MNQENKQYVIPGQVFTLRTCNMPEVIPASEKAKILHEGLTTVTEPMTAEQTYAYNHRWASLRGNSESVLTILDQMNSPNQPFLRLYNGVSQDGNICTIYRIKYSPKKDEEAKSLSLSKLSEIPVLTDDRQIMDLYAKSSLNFKSSEESWDDFSDMIYKDGSKHLAINNARIVSELVYYPDSPLSSKLIATVNPSRGLSQFNGPPTVFKYDHMYFQHRYNDIPADFISSGQFEVFYSLTSGFNQMVEALNKLR